MPDKEFLSEHSTYIENVMRHCFLYEVTRHLLSLPIPQKVTILDSEVDSDGVDVILVWKQISRHIQMKTLSRITTSNPYPIAESLSGLPGACILWMCYDRDTMRPTCYHLMGGRGNAPLRDLSAFRIYTKKTKVRQGRRAVRVRDAEHKGLTLRQLI